MTFLLAGGSGFLGRALSRHLAAAGHRVLTLTRRPRPGAAGDIAWMPDGSVDAWAGHLEGADAVINLAGEGIADRRWTTARKRRLRDSRLQAARSLTAAIRACRIPPRVFAGASAVGYYGAHDDEPITEQTTPGTDFLASLCVEWERESLGAATSSTRVALLRTGLVMHPSGGPLQKMLLPFKLGLGGRLGSGRQFMPWIHLIDWVRLVEWIVREDAADGPFNLSAPVPVTNAEFTRALGRALRRPAILPVPTLALRLALGELADALLTGARVMPERAERMGFTFQFSEIGVALADLLTQK
jgi:hypothetical protein